MSDQEPIIKVSHTRVRKVFNSTAVSSSGSSSSQSDVQDSGDLVFGSTGYRNNHWRSQVSLHKDATTTFSATSCNVRRHMGEDSFVRVTNFPSYASKIVTSGFVRPLSSTVWTPPLTSPDLRALALSNFYAQCYDALTDVGGGILGGELKETLALLTHPYSSLLSLLRGYRKRLVSAKKHLPRSPGKMTTVQQDKWLKIVGDAWLETQFGLLPTLSDIGDIVDSLIGIPASDYANVVGVATKKEVTSSLPFASNPFHLGIGSWNVLQKQSDMKYYRFRGQVVRDFTSLGKLERLGLSPVKDFLPTLYEVCPWSWIVDYFSNFGNCLKALSVPASSISWVCETERLERVTQVIQTPLPVTGSSTFPTYLPVVDGKNALVVVTKSVRRAPAASIVGAGPPLPHLALKLPSLRQNANLIALAGSFLRPDVLPYSPH